MKDMDATPYRCKMTPFNSCLCFYGNVIGDLTSVLLCLSFMVSSLHVSLLKSNVSFQNMSICFFELLLNCRSIQE